MSENNQFVLLAEYNRLMNQRQFEAAGKLSTDDLRRDMGAFFKSVLGTLNHILVGDIVWLKRIAELPSSSEGLAYVKEIEKPASLDTLLFDNLIELKSVREMLDDTIIQWIKQLSDDELKTCLRYRDMAGQPYQKPLFSLIHHLFLHQVHHRGQVTTLLSQLGIDFGETDLLELIIECT